MNLVTRARFYDSLATAIAAGLPPDQALGASAPHGKDSLDSALAMSAELAAGRELSAVLRARSNIFSAQEAAIILAGEKSGRLPQALKRLAESFSREAAFRRELAWSLGYPAALLHAAVLLPKLSLIVTNGLKTYLAQVAVTLGLLYFLAFITWALSRQGPVQRLLPSLPLVGRVLRLRAHADYAFVLGSLLSAGAPLIESLRSAATSVGRKDLRAAGLRVAMAVRGGSTLHEAMASDEKIFGPILLENIHVGEVSGKLDELLVRAEVDARKQAQRAIRVLAVVLSIIAFAIVVLVVAWAVISFWSDYADQLEI